MAESFERLLYIKLGAGGDWEKQCIHDGTIRLGYDDLDHELCLAGKWDQVMQQAYPGSSSSPGKAGAASRHISQVKYFYEEPDTTVWFTFFGDHLWWCRAERVIKRLSDRSKIRQVIGQWKSVDLSGKPIVISTLSGKLIQTRSFRGTICQPAASAYLQSRLLGKKMPEVQRANEARSALTDAVLPLIKGLQPDDLEILVEMIFQHSGFQRLTKTGGVQKTLDLDLISPVTKQKALVQVKARSSEDEFKSYIKRFQDMKEHQLFYYIIAEESESIARIGREEADENLEVTVEVIEGRDLGDLVVRAGLVDWVINKAG